MHGSNNRSRLADWLRELLSFLPRFNTALQQFTIVRCSDAGEPSLQYGDGIGVQ